MSSATTPPTPWTDHRTRPPARTRRRPAKNLLHTRCQTLSVPDRSSPPLAPRDQQAISTRSYARTPFLALSAGSAALSRLADLVTLDIAVLEAIEPCLPDHAHIDLDLGSAAVFDRLIQHRLSRTAEPAERAALFTQLGWRYGNAGLNEQALVTTTQAVDYYRALSETDPRTYLPHLAVALGNLGGLPSALEGSRAQAVESRQEAVSIYRDLSRLRPVVYLPDFAAALNGLSNSLADVGRWNEGARSRPRGLKLRRQQAETEPDRYQRGLAIALTSLGIRYSQAGLSAQALDPAREAVALLRTLAQANPPARTSPTSPQPAPA